MIHQVLLESKSPTFDIQQQRCLKRAHVNSEPLLKMNQTVKGAIGLNSVLRIIDYLKHY